MPNQKIAATIFPLCLLAIALPLRAGPVALDTTNTSTLSVTIDEAPALDPAATVSSLPYTMPLTDTDLTETSTLTPDLTTSDFTLTFAQTAVNPGSSDTGSADLFFIAGPNVIYNANATLTSNNANGDNLTIYLTDKTANANVLTEIANDTPSSDFLPASDPLTAGDLFEFQVSASLDGPAFQTIIPAAPAPFTLAANVDLSFTQVPEPSIAGSLAIAAVLAIRRRRM